MRRIVFVMVLALAVAACGHTRKTESAPQSTTVESARPTKARTKRTAQEAPSAPDELLAKGAIADLQNSLAQRGLLATYKPDRLDAATQEAIRKFQEHERLPATGLPDRETARRLGVNPDGMYRKQKGNPNERQEQHKQQ